ncbi:MAG: regulatory iron-sulfur-containing complex subunit RicT, partial [Coriobacteriales bacterium]|nr:regulatory iron-sulfur-containing complex subunit RicT [Coriobacteriales bacterium]
MPTIIPVKFAYAARDLWFDPQDSGALEGDHVICSTERGTEIGLAMGDPRQLSKSELSQAVHNSSLKPILRVATEEDLERADQLARKGDEAMPAFRAAVSQSDLDMKPVGVEYLFGGEKVVCYFAAEDRVDFRQLVRELSRTLHERIDMRQIGVREEAAVIGGFGHCGEELCCSRFGLNFEPVSIRMAKEQDLPLTSNKISGACGRLMCCLRYEFEAYRDFKGRAPKRNAIIDTPLGNAKVVEYDTPKEQLALRLENGKIVRIPLAEMKASDAAVKKSEELNCACRPDTVVRESLEKLSSPDVQMALAELDRKMGVVQDDVFDSSDIFVSAKPRRRRNRSSEAESQQRAAEGGKEQQSATGERRTRRRRNNKAEEPASASAVPQTQTKAQAEADTTEKRTRRRRRRKTNVGANAAEGQNQTQNGQGSNKQEGRTPRSQNGSKRQEQQAEQAPKESRRRRHHRSGSDAPT